MSADNGAPDVPPEMRMKLDANLRDVEARQKSTVFGHPLWEAATKETLNSISYWETGCMSAIIGPTGVGKSTLLHELEKRLRRELATDSRADIPVVRIAAIPQPNSPFSWKDFYTRMLDKLNGPLSDELEERPSNARRVIGKRWTEGDLRRDFEKAALARRTKVILIDEAHHIALGRAQTMLMQLEVLKSIGDMSEAHLILGAPYELLSKIDLNGQLSRRISVIHFPRYKMNSAELGNFRDALGDLVDDMTPWKFEVDLENIKEVEYFFLRSVGCIGILRPWLLRAVRNSARAGSWVVTRKQLNSEAKTTSALNVILTEIEEGEEKLADAPHDWAALEMRLSRDKDRGNEKKANGGKVHGDAKNHGESANGGGNGTRKLLPGEAAPRRYPTDSSGGKGT